MMETWKYHINSEVSTMNEHIYTETGEIIIICPDCGFGNTRERMNKNQYGAVQCIGCHGWISHPSCHAIMRED
jgi:ssDNA-binding Zn-finger/Zn-ribbon topoisomerase 1